MMMNSARIQQQQQQWRKEARTSMPLCEGTLLSEDRATKNDSKNNRFRDCKINDNDSNQSVKHYK